MRALVAMLGLVSFAVAPATAQDRTHDMPAAGQLTQEVSVPSLVDRPLGEAVKVLARLGLRLGQVDEVSSDAAPGTVLKQSISPGSRVPPGRTIDLVIAAGARASVVPTLVGSMVTDAAATLRTAGLGLGALSQVEESHVRPGSVLAQYPAAGSRVPPGTTVALQIAASPPVGLPSEPALKPPPPPLDDGAGLNHARPPSAASVALADSVLRDLDWANIAFTVPPRMRYREAQLIELVLSPSLSVVQLRGELDKAGVDTARIRISNRMAAQLTGQGFDIAGVTPELQAVTSLQPSRWRWEVTPTSGGSQTLNLTLSAHVDLGGRDAPLVIQTFHRTIEVDVTARQLLSGFILKNWQWLWAAVLVPVGGYLWKRGRKRTNGAPTAGGSGGA